ncbi:unnamed protein product [Symbiodinium pilosum]|uniref:Uncharacterized protein n=1 Tax=Symbiodinium pilosum TaxID=2952 RepID=A0A812VJN3_SYMPI|nr:unnamed protein product [Symbiodinium pilosum]
MFMCFPADGNCCFQEETEMRPDADPFTLAGNAGTVATGEDVAGTEEYENAADDGTPRAGVFHADQAKFSNDKLVSGDTDFRLKEQLSPALRQEVEQIKADIAAQQALKAAENGGQDSATLTDVAETDSKAEAQLAATFFKTVVAFGLKSLPVVPQSQQRLGLSLKFHEARCGGIPAEPQPEQLAPPPFLPHVDRQVDMAVLKLEDQVRTLFLPGTEVRKIMQEHPDLGREMLNLIIVTWRPGDVESSLKVKAVLQRHGLRLISQSHVTFDLLEDDLVKSAQFDGLAMDGENIHEVLLERCRMLQQLCRRAAANVASRGGA